MSTKRLILIFSLHLLLQNGFWNCQQKLLQVIIRFYQQKVFCLIIRWSSLSLYYLIKFFQPSYQKQSYPLLAYQSIVFWWGVWGAFLPGADKMHPIKYWNVIRWTFGMYKLKRRIIFLWLIWNYTGTQIDRYLTLKIAIVRSWAPN